MVVTQEEEKNRKIAMGVSAAVHLILLLLLFYIMAWQAPDPPLDQLGGIEISFGTTETGSGDTQSKASPNESTNPEDSAPAAEAPKAVPTPQAQPKTAAAPVEKVATTTADAPVSVKEEKVEPKPEPVKEEPKKVDNRALFPGKAKTGTGNGTAGTSNNPTGNNNGDEGTVGDKGRPEGQYPGKKTGAGGSGGGPLNMPGWRFDIEPRTDPYDNESGKVVFRVRIDKDGEITGLDVVESNVSPQVVNWYRNEVRKTSFSRIKGNDSNTGASGLITFIIRAN
ncbi:hypothetical protein [Nibribacter koreensis]|uniref:Protein TonB, links inner and outer membranes n=1 Tax=Nibribacter koreensis TaxID=1084519 RepID=A0ABP8F8J9_9BACT